MSEMNLRGTRRTIEAECAERTSEEFLAYLAAHSDDLKALDKNYRAKAFGAFMNEVWAIVIEKFEGE